MVVSPDYFWLMHSEDKIVIGFKYKIIQIALYIMIATWLSYVHY